MNRSGSVLLKSVSGRLKIALASPLFPPSTDGVEVEWKVSGGGFEEKGWSHAASGEFTAGRGEGVDLLPVCIQDNLVSRQFDRIISSNLNNPLGVFGLYQMTF